MKTKLFRNVKTYAIICLFLSFVLSLGLVFNVNAPAKAENTATEKAIHIAMDTQSDAFKTGVDGLNPTDSVSFAVMPFPAVNDTCHNMKNDAFGSWWDGFGELEISYEVYSPTFIPGMDGVCLFVQDDPWIMKNADFTDEAGNHVTNQDPATSSLYANGWRKRTFTVNVGTNKVEHLGFVFCVQTEDLPTTGTIDIYYKNVTIKHHGNTYNVFGQENAEYSAEEVNLTSQGKPIVGEYLTTRIWNSEYSTLSAATGVGALRGTTLGATFEATNAPEIKVEDDATTDTAIRVYIDTTTEQFASDYAQATADDVKFIFGVSPFPAMSNNGYSLIMANNAIANWWNAWGEFEFSYDFYAPDFKPGMAGLGFTYNATPYISKHADYSDTEGFANVCYDDGFVAKFQNGWYNRTFKINLTAENGKNPRDPYFLFAVEKKDIPTSGVLEFFIDNVKVKVNGVTYNLYGGENAIFDDAGINATAKGEAVNGFTKALPYMTSWGNISGMTGQSKAKALTLGAKFEATTTPEIKVEEEEEELLPGEKAINISIDTQSDEFKSGIADIAGTSSVSFAVMPFPCLNDTGCSMKNDAFGTWWGDGFGELTISYDFYSNTFIPGMDGVLVFVDQSPWIMSNTDFTDEVGNNSTVQTAESAQYYQNGWRRRTFTVTIPQGVFVEHIGFVFCAKVDDLPDSGIINLYYKNITIAHHGTTYNVYGQVDENNNEIAVFTAEHVNKTAKGEAIGDHTLTKRVWNSQYGTLSTATGVGALRGTTLGATFKAVNALALDSIATTTPENVLAGTVCDLTTLATSSTTVTIDSITKDGVAVDLTTVNVNEFTLEAGKYEIMYKAVGENNTAIARVNFTVKALPENLVTYVYNNGTANYTYSLAEGEKIAQPEANPTRVGFAFNGWVDAEGNAFDFSKVYNEDVVIYASWKGAEGSSAIRVYIDTNSEQFKSDITKGKSDTKFIFGVSPFPAMSADGNSFKFAANNIPNWWTAWGETVFSYDFFAPNFKPGMGGMSLMYSADPWFSKAGDFKDANGYDNVCYDDAFTSALGNGWYNRTFTMNIAEGTGLYPTEMYFLFAVAKEDIPTSGIIEFYITNVNVTCRGVTYNLYGGEDAFFTNDGVNATAKGEAFNGYTKVNVWQTSWGTIRDMTGSGNNAANVTLGANFEAGQAPDIDHVSVEIPEILYTETNYDLIGYSNNAEVIAISNENGEVSLDGVDFANYTFGEDGKWVVTYGITKNGYTAKKTVEFIVSDINTPVLLESDVQPAIPTNAVAHESIALGKVFASVQGEKTLKATPYVTNANGDVFEVTETEDGWKFVPTAKKNDVYTVVYKAENSAGVATSKGYTITVTDVDKPVVDFTYLDGFFVASYYEVEKVISLIDVSDISDGMLSVASISIVDPFGNELIKDGTVKFMIPYSGEYTVTVVSVEDSDGNVTTASAKVNSRQTEGLILAIEANIAEDKRAEGVEKTFDTQIGRTPACALNVGDTISFDVMAYTVYADGTYGFIPGLGAITGQIEGTWEMIYDLFGEKECLDSNGYSMARTANLSAVLQDANGMPVWYNRTYKITSGDAIFGRILHHFAVGFSTTAACGEKIVVMYRNARVLDAEGNVKYLLWTGVQDIARAYTHGNITTANVYATYDVAPVPVDGKIPSTAKYGEYISISKNLMKDASMDATIPSVVKIIAPNGTEVQVQETATGFEFEIAQLGVYSVIVSATNNKGYTTSKEYTIAVQDAERPTITFEQNSETFYAGDNAVIEVEIEDDIFDFADFKEVGYTFKFNDEVVEVDVQNTAKGFTFTFTAQVGEYSLIVYATDGANNETVEVKNFTVEEKPATSDSTVDSTTDSASTAPSSGCIGGISASSMMAVVTVFAMAIVLGLKRKNNR